MFKPMLANKRTVGVVGNNSVEYVKAIFAVYNSGEVAITLTNPEDDECERFGRIDEIVTPDLGRGWSGPLPTLGIHSSGPAHIQFSSGTEGAAKAVVLSHQALASTTKRLADLSEISSEIREYIGTPVSHSFGLARCRLISHAGGQFFLPPHGFNPFELASLIRDADVNAISAVPTMWRALLTQRALFAGIGHKIRWIEIGSQFMSSDEKKHVRALFPHANIIQHYGLTEASRTSLLRVDTATELELASVGKAYGDIDIRISKAGTIQTRGSHIASGRLVDGEVVPLTDAEGWLTTGDLGHLENGFLHYSGRVDEIINCGGLKYSPDLLQQQIDRDLAIDGHLPVAYTIVRGPDSIRGEIPILMFESTNDFSAHEFEKLSRDSLGKIHSDLSRAARFLTIDKLPTTKNGKIKRSALADLVAELETPGKGVSQDTANAQPSSKVILDSESSALVDYVGAFWNAALARDQVKYDQSFFDAGGDSLSAMSAITSMETSGIPQDVALAIFEGATVTELATRLQEQHYQPRESGESSTNSHDTVDIEEHALGQQLESHPLATANTSLNDDVHSTRDTRLKPSPAQENLWLLHQIAQSSTEYITSLRFRINGSVDVRALQNSLDHLIHRHEALRSNIVCAPGDSEPTLSIRYNRIALEELDFSQHNHPAGELRQFLRKQAATDFDLADDLLFRASLIKLAEERFELLLEMHHIATDGWSQGLIKREISDLYEANVKGLSLELAPPSLRYAQYAQQHRRQIHSEDFSTQTAYWTAKLENAPQKTNLPTDYPRPAVLQSNGSELEFQIAPPVLDRLRELSSRQNATLFMVLLAAFKILISRLSGDSDIVVGTALSNRSTPGRESVVGLFVNMVPIRSDQSANPLFDEFLGQVRSAVLEAFQHPDVPFNTLMEILKPARQQSYSPIFQVALIMQPPKSELSLCGLDVQPGSSIPGLVSDTAKYDLTLDIVERDHELLCALQYNTNLFNDERIRRVEEQWRYLLDELLDNTAQPISDLKIESGRQRQLTLEQLTANSVPYADDVSIPELFERKASQTPWATAVRCNNEALTFEQLNQRANQFAHYLVECGVQDRDFVAICVERELPMAVALLGVLKSGAGYVALDPAYPAERLTFMLADSGAGLLIVQHDDAVELPASNNVTTINIVSDQRSWASKPDTNLDLSISIDQAAYMIYTSGSTGQPKGVVAPHRGAVNRFHWMWRAYPFEHDDVCCLNTSLAFVDSVCSFFGPLLAGIPVVLFSESTVMDPGLFIRELSGERVTRLTAVPSLVRVLLDTQKANDAILSQLRVCFCSGEALPPSLARDFLQTLPDCRLLNLYGSSEVAADVTYYEVTADDLDQRVSIGKPISNSAVFILDRNHNVVPTGVDGEVYVAGDGLAIGYHNLPKLSREKFITKDTITGKPVALFRTGDVGRYRQDGNIELLGRLDRQVKIRGVRIELDEIEATLLTHHGVSEAVVVPHHEHDQRDDSPSDLAAYFIGDSLTQPALRAFLTDLLPPQMVPRWFVHLQSLPLTPNGKLDIAALPEPVGIHSAERIKRKTGSTRAADEDTSLLRSSVSQIWSDVLGIPTVGLDDDFFNLGGNSLLAVKLQARILTILNHDIPLASLLEAPTINAQVKMLASSQYDAAWAVLVPLSTRGSQPPLFCFHAVGGNVISLKKLSELLQIDRPFYALQSQGLDGTSTPHSSIETMASSYIKEIRTVQRHGPYVFAGQSSGGLVAFEAARQLRATGETVEQLILIDTYEPTLATDPETKTSRNSKSVISKTGFHLHAIRTREANERLGYILSATKRKGARLRTKIERRVTQRLAQWYQNRGRPLPPRFRPALIRTAQLQAIRSYRVRPYDVDIALISATRTKYAYLRAQSRRDKSIWASLTSGKFVEYTIDGNHNLESDNTVQELANIIETQLQHQTLSGAN